MKTKNRIGLMAAAVGLLIAGGAISVTAQDSKEAAVKARQDFMKAQGADVKAITDYSKGQGDKAAAEKAADDLVARAPKIAALFPPGTSATDFPGKSNAKPEIWSDMDKFKAIPVALEGEAKKLATTVKTGTPQAVADQLGAMGKAGCGACHGTYRVKTS